MTDASRKIEELEQGLHDARRTSQKRAQRISALKSCIEELESAREEDKRLLHYLLADAFERRGPWVTGVRIDGRNYGRQPRNHSPRLAEFFETFPEASRGRVLEPGSLEGAMTVELARRATEVVGLEGRPQSVERAEFLKGLFAAENASFRVADIEEEDLTSYGAFDAVFCCGLLYHLARPRAFVERVAAEHGEIHAMPRSMLHSHARYEKVFSVGPTFVPLYNEKTFVTNLQGWLDEAPVVYVNLGTRKLMS